MSIHKKINKNFFKKWTNDMAYVLGFFAADGYITIHKNGGQFWCIQITDGTLLESIKKAIRSDHKISVRTPTNQRKSVSYRIQIGSKEMCNDLRKLGFSERKTKSMAIPNVPQKYFPDFVRGYFDGDGNIWQGEIHKERKTTHWVLKLSFTSGSLEFLKELHTRLNFLGISGGCLYQSKKKQFYRLQFSTLSALKLYDFMYNGNIKGFSGLLLDRKREIFDNFKSLRL